MVDFVGSVVVVATETAQEEWCKVASSVGPFAIAGAAVVDAAIVAVVGVAVVVAFGFVVVSVVIVGDGEGMVGEGGCTGEGEEVGDHSHDLEQMEGTVAAVVGSD
jgi:hypothetical protein